MLICNQHCQQQELQPAVHFLHKVPQGIPTASALQLHNRARSYKHNMLTILQSLNQLNSIPSAAHNSPLLVKAFTHQSFKHECYSDVSSSDSSPLSSAATSPFPAASPSLAAVPSLTCSSSKSDASLPTSSAPYNKHVSHQRPHWCFLAVVYHAK